MTSAPRTPVRKLYDQLVSLLGSRDDLHECLRLTHEDYRTCVGDPEPRFCEWAYHRIEGRSLVKGLLAILRPNDPSKLAERAGVPPETHQALGTEQIMRIALLALGVKEPMTPDPLRDGVAELERYRIALDLAIKGIDDATLEPQPFTPPVEIGRRGAERLLRIACFFLWDNGAKEIIKRVATDGAHGFNKVHVEDWEPWLRRLDLGTLNYLLRATSREIVVSSTTMPFLRSEQEIWSERAFQGINALCEAFQVVLHDKGNLGESQRLAKQFRAVSRVLEDIKSVSPPIWRPRVIQFFRRTEDAHSIHYEGYDDTGKLVQFFESPQPWELHRSYLFMAATNPSAVDVCCSQLRDEFARPV